mmetsp:Transcript_11438/g.28867  ORF Transcript_11438/g.28867 Transcript_11438/m.28867 type:complete len:246 (-) Transcript_11438:2982-3719(-)
MEGGADELAEGLFQALPVPCHKQHLIATEDPPLRRKTAKTTVARGGGTTSAVCNAADITAATGCCGFGRCERCSVILGGAYFARIADNGKDAMHILLHPKVGPLPSVPPPFHLQDRHACQVRSAMHPAPEGRHQRIDGRTNHGGVRVQRLLEAAHGFLRLLQSCSRLHIRRAHCLQALRLDLCQSLNALQSALQFLPRSRIQQAMRACICNGETDQAKLGCRPLAAQATLCVGPIGKPEPVGTLP